MSVDTERMTIDLYEEISKIVEFEADEFLCEIKTKELNDEIDVEIDFEYIEGDAGCYRCSDGSGYPPTPDELIIYDVYIKTTFGKISIYPEICADEDFSDIMFNKFINIERGW